MDIRSQSLQTLSMTLLLKKYLTEMICNILISTKTKFWILTLIAEFTFAQDIHLFTWVKISKLFCGLNRKTQAKICQIINLQTLQQQEKSQNLKQTWMLHLTNQATLSPKWQNRMLMNFWISLWHQPTEMM